MSILTIGMLVAGFALLGLGGEFLVRGASNLAAAIGLSPLVVGLTVVAFGTSSPELAVSLQAGLSGQTDVALGNVVGSNIFNVLFILGICAIILPLMVARQLLRRDVPIMIGASIVMLLLALDGQLSQLDGALLFGGLLLYLTFTIRQSRKEQAREHTAALAAGASEAAPAPRRSLLWTASQVGFVVLGIGLLVLGSRWMVDGAVTIARAFNISELVIGLTIVAVGTSLPEVAASIVASLKGERDIAVGNVMGSNIFNLLAILGLASIFSPINVSPVALAVDIPVMLAVMFVCLPICFTGFMVARWEGVLLFGSYIVYTSYLILNSLQHPLLAPLLTLLALVLPVVVVGLLAHGLYTLVQSRRQVPRHAS